MQSAVLGFLVFFVNYCKYKLWLVFLTLEFRIPDTTSGLCEVSCVNE